MNVRQFMNENSALVTIACIGLLIVALGYIIWFTTMRGGSRNYGPRPIYYFDAATGQIFTAPSDEIPPIQSPGQDPGDTVPKGYRVMLFSCSTCPDDVSGMSLEQLQQAGVNVGYMEAYKPDVKEMLIEARDYDGDGPPPEAFMQLEAQEEGHLISANGQEWVAMNTMEAQEIQMSSYTICGENARATPCYPPK